MLSPNTIAGLMARHMSYDTGVDRAIANQSAGGRKHQARPKPEPVVMWCCPRCSWIHDDQDDASDCCPEDDNGAEAHMGEAACICPVCGTDHSGVKAAADCCLWHDLADAQREEVARRVGEGATWLQAIELAVGSLPEVLLHLINESPSKME